MLLLNNVKTRRVELDRLRGLAVVLMIGDHLAIILGLSLYRVTAGRLAMPLFFILAGHLAGRLGYRQVWAVVLGLVLPVVSVLVDRPNVLVWWGLGCAGLWICDRLAVPAWSLAVAALTFAANGWAVTPGPLSYDPVALIGLMALGKCASSSAFLLGARLPAVLGRIGRYPLSWYVGHLLVLQGFVLVAGVAVHV